mgnify:CR=1 FL=1
MHILCFLCYRVAKKVVFVHSRGEKVHRVSRAFQTTERCAFVCKKLYTKIALKIILTYFSSLK